MHVDTTLLFGLCSTPLTFTALADGSEWILHQQDISYIAHYFDNFITLGAPGSEQCSNNLAILFETRTELGITLAAH